MAVSVVDFLLCFCVVYYFNSDALATTFSPEVESSSTDSLSCLNLIEVAITRNVADRIEKYVILPIANLIDKIGSVLSKSATLPNTKGAGK